MRDPSYNPFAEADFYKGKQTNNSDTTNESVYDYSNSKKSEVKIHNTLDELPISERTQVAASIYATKLRQISHIFEKIASDAEDKHYFPSDLSSQKELILAAEGFYQYLNPLYNDKFTLDWVQLFEEVVNQLCKDNDFTEEPLFVREVRWQIYTNGEIKNQFPFTKNHILGTSIINRINKIIFISNCIPFMSKLWKNNRQTRYPQQVKRDERKYKED